MEKHVQAALIVLERYWIKNFKIVFLNIYNCMYKTLVSRGQTTIFVQGRYHFQYKGPTWKKVWYTSISLIVFAPRLSVDRC